jgi:hypothetical protein
VSNKGKRIKTKKKNERGNWDARNKDSERDKLEEN